MVSEFLLLVCQQLSKVTFRPVESHFYPGNLFLTLIDFFKNQSNKKLIKWKQ